MSAEIIEASKAPAPPVQPTGQRAPAAVTPMQILAMAVENGASIEMMERLMTLQERWEANEARKAFVAALVAFKADPPTVIKNKHVGFQSRDGSTEYDHATLDQVCSIIGAALSRHGLSHRWEVEQGDLIRVSCIITHQLGHSERVPLQAAPDMSGKKNPIQAIGSTVTYLERYTLLAATGLAAKDQDDDGRSFSGSDTISAAQKDELIEAMKETGTDTKRFLAYLRVETLDDLPAAEFGNAKAALEKKKEKAR